MDPSVVSGSVASVAGIGRDEAWLRDWVREDPSRLGLGDLRSSQPDALKASGEAILAADDEHLFNVAVHLGGLDAVAAFGLLQDWAANRKVEPDKAHVAVLLTEVLGDEYRGTLEVLAERLPLVVVELAVWRGEQEAIVVPHIALAAESVDLATAPASAARTALARVRHVEAAAATQVVEPPEAGSASVEPIEMAADLADAEPSDDGPEVTITDSAADEATADQAEEADEAATVPAEAETEPRSASGVDPWQLSAARTGTSLLDERLATIGRR
jgi:hypothetical protein